MDDPRDSSSAEKDDQEYRRALDASRAAARRNEYARAAEFMEAYVRAFPQGRHFRAAEHRAIGLRSMLRSVDGLVAEGEEDARQGRPEDAVRKWKRALLIDPTRRDLRKRVRKAEAALLKDAPRPAADPDEPRPEALAVAASPSPVRIAPLPSAPRRAPFPARALLFPALALAAAAGLWVWLWLSNVAHVHRALELAAAGDPEGALREYGLARSLPFLPAVPPCPAEWAGAASEKREALAVEAAANEMRRAAEVAEAPSWAKEDWMRATDLAGRARAALERGAFAEARRDGVAAAEVFSAARTFAEARVAEAVVALAKVEEARAAAEAAGAPVFSPAAWARAGESVRLARAARENRAPEALRAAVDAANKELDACIKDVRAGAAEKQDVLRLRSDVAAMREAVLKIEGDQTAAFAWETGEQRRREADAALEKNIFADARAAYEKARTAFEECRLQALDAEDARKAAAAAREAAEVARKAAEPLRAELPRHLAAADQPLAEAAKRFDTREYDRARALWDAARERYAAAPALDEARRQAVAARAEAERARAAAQKEDARRLASPRWQEAEARLRRAADQIKDEQFEAAAKSAAEAARDFAAAVEEGKEKSAQRETARREEKRASDAKTRARELKAEEYARAEWSEAERLARSAAEQSAKGYFAAASAAWQAAAERYSAAGRSAQAALRHAYDEHNAEGRRAYSDRRFPEAVEAWKAARTLGALLETRPDDLPLMDLRLENCARSLRVPDGFRAAENAAADKETGWADRIVHPRSGIELVLVPMGSFLMGGPLPEESPTQVVNITKPFYVGKFEVTQGEWERVMGRNPSRLPGAPRLPVDSVSWNDCQEFLRKAGDGLRLPTEAEWEYACRAWTQTVFSVGDALRATQANFNSGAPRAADAPPAAATPVGSFFANAWGLHDVHGNVAEWCQDRFDAEGYRNRATIDDPQGPEQGALRVVRGGSFRDPASGCRSARRSGVDPDERAETIGLRVARSCTP